MDWEYLQAQTPSPRETMHSELLVHVNRHEVEIADRTTHPYFEIAAWLKLTNTAQLPSMLLIEYSDSNGSGWKIVDTARMHSMKGTLLLSGAVSLSVKILKGIDIYICHPNPALVCEIDELRLNGRLLRRGFLEQYKTG